jgi:hypothetical protein
MAVTILMFFLVNQYVYWLVEDNISEKHAVSIFRSEMMSWDCDGPYIEGCSRGCLRERAQLGQVRQKLCQANEEAPSWYQKSRRLVMVVWVQQ